jgi:hypothetical protein
MDPEWRNALLEIGYKESDIDRIFISSRECACDIHEKYHIVCDVTEKTTYYGFLILPKDYRGAWAWAADYRITDGYFFGYWQYTGDRHDYIWAELKKMNQRMQSTVMVDNISKPDNRGIFPQSGSSLYMQWEYYSDGPQWYSHSIRFLKSRRWRERHKREPALEEYVNIRESLALELFYRAMERLRNNDSWERCDTPISLGTQLMAVGMKAADTEKEPE